MFGTKTIEFVDRNLQEELKKELADQGHHLTGTLENSIQSTTKNSVLEVYAEDYLGGNGEGLGPLNTGVAADRVPFNSANRTGAKTSQYIQGLVSFVKLRMGITDDKEALSVAFAIAKTHEKEGMPSQASYSHSKNGRRTQSLEESFERNGKVELQIEEGLSNELDSLLGMDGSVTVI